MKLLSYVLFASVALTVACGANLTDNQNRASDHNNGTSVGQNKPTKPVSPTTSVDEIRESAEVDSYDVQINDSKTTLLATPVKSAVMAKTVNEEVYRLEAESYPATTILDEPNTENYALQNISNIKRVLATPVSTLSTDVDTASYSNARRFLQQGVLPPKESIRVEEFINYFDYNLESPSSADAPIAIETELMQTPWNEHTQLMRVSLQAYRTKIESLPPLNLVFLLDVSGSMNNPDKLPLMQRSFNLLVNQLRAQDHVAIVVYAGASGVALEPTSGDQKPKILNAINELRAGGSTHGSAGIQLAYDLAQENFKADSVNRVILGTDGDFNVGTTGIEALKNLIEKKRESGVFLNVLGFGTGNYNDYMMEEISNHGNGIAYYIDSFQEARKVFAEQLTSTLQTVAKDVKIQIEFNPEHVAEYRLIGYENRLLNREDFNNDTVDAGEMGAGHTVTALYEIVTTNSEFRFIDPLRFGDKKTEPNRHSDELAFVKVRYKLPDQDNSKLMSIPVNNTPVAKPSQSMTLAASVAAFAEILRGSPYINAVNLKTVANDIAITLSGDRWGYRQELLQLIKNAEALETD